MIAHRGRNHPVPALPFAELGYLIGGSAHLERPCSLQILRLEIHVRLGHCTKSSRMQHGCYMDCIANHLAGILDLSQRWGIEDWLEVYCTHLNRSPFWI